jgi:hypothetical protein
MVKPSPKEATHPLSPNELTFWRHKAQEYRQEAYAIERMLEEQEQIERKDID